jgi:hypothetical protein
MCVSYLVTVEGRCSTCGGYELVRLETPEIAASTPISRA